MKVITCASFYGSGSSAIIDFFSEFNDVKKMGNYEFRIFYDIDGISDLQFHLVECQNRHNSGHALKRFERLAKFYSGSSLVKRYEPFFDNKFYKTTHEYIESLKNFEYEGWWFYDLYDRGRKYYFFKQLINHFIKLFTKKNSNILKRTRTYCSNLEEGEFLEKTRNYSHNLLMNANKENFDYLAIDQLLPSQNTKRVMKYFKDDIYVFIVDRDPRDVYLCEMLKWHEGIVPHDPKMFCKWYRYSRNNYRRDIDGKKIFFVQFEDLIYKYDETVNYVGSIVGIDSKNHVSQFKFLNPKKSVVNTMLYAKTDKYKDAIKIIEEELTEYLYDFSSVCCNEIVGIDIDNKEIF